MKECNKNSWEKREDLVEVLYNDAKENFELMQLNSTDLNRRNYVRSLFALYEAIIANLRETIADRIITKRVALGCLDIHEIYPLMDETATIDEAGKISKRYNQSPFKNLVKYLLKLACKEYNIEDNLFEKGWSDFQLSIQIRHRITHPKYESDVTITDKELEVIERGRKWWNDTLNKLKPEQ